MRTDEGTTNASSLLRALANPTRIEILSALSAGELSVFDLRSHFPLSQSALSQHLAKLRAHHLVGRCQPKMMEPSFAGPLARIPGSSRRLFEKHEGRRGGRAAEI